MEKRLYLTKVVTVDKGTPIGLTQVPYLASLPIDPVDSSDLYHWDVVYDSKGDPDGETPGIHDTCIVGVYTTLENHTLLESDPDITRIDDI